MAPDWTATSWTSDSSGNANLEHRAIRAYEIVTSKDAAIVASAEHSNDNQMLALLPSRYYKGEFTYVQGWAEQLSSRVLQISACMLKT